jgi:hypothetical protein
MRCFFLLKIEIQYWRTRTKTLVPSSVPTLKIDVDFIAAIGILYSQWNEGTTVILQLLQRRRWRCVNFRHLSGNNQRPRTDSPWAILYEKGSRRIVIVYRRSNTKVCLFLDNHGSRQEIDNQRDQRIKQKKKIFLHHWGIIYFICCMTTKNDVTPKGNIY